jgi:hypothetical protein
VPSPAFILRDVGFTADEIKALIRELITTGRINSLGGAAKTSSFENVPFPQLLIELRAELDRLTGVVRPQKVVQILTDRPFNGAYAGGAFSLP